MDTNERHPDDRARSHGRGVDYLALAHGAYYLCTGVWPLLHRRSFERVTGPKADFWLVNTVGLLVAVIGKELLLAGLGRGDSPSAPRLGLSSASSLAAIDLAYSLRGRIGRVFLLEGLVEVGLAAAWLARLAGKGRPR